MKRILLFGALLLFSTQVLKAQIELPVTFEDGTVNYELVDFGNNASEIVADPTDSTNLVVKSIKSDSAETWAGTTVANENGFTNPIPFTENETSMTVRVWSSAAGIPVRLKVEDHTNTNISVETEDTTTVTEGWETLTFDFSNEATGTAALNLANSYTKASIFYNFGTSGADAGELTFYWDDVEFGGGSTTEPEPSVLDFPLTFEEGIAWEDYFTGFDGGNFSVIANPDVSGINVTDSVLQIVKNAGQTWAGGYIHMPQALNVTEDFAITVNVWAPRDSTKMLLKIENEVDGAINTETEVIIPESQTWTEVTVDLSAANIANDYHKLVFIFDNGTMGDGSADFTWFVDELRYDVVDGVEPNPTAIALPVTFEDGDKAYYELTDFGANQSDIVVDPTDAENMVVQSTKTATAETWAGTTVADANGFAGPIPFTENSTSMSVRVWSPAADLPIRLKVEDHTNTDISVETEATTTVAEGWEVLTFDFSNEAAGTAALNLANNYTKASIFFNFGTSGADAGELTFYWDDVMMSDDGAAGQFTPIADARTFEDSTVVLTGIATTPNYGFNDGQWFIQDETGGINAYFGGQGALEVAAGDEHILYGTISSYNGQVQISVDSAEVVSTGNDVFVYEIALAEFLNVESELQGMYVMLDEPATYLAEISDWPVEGFTNWSGAGTNVFFQVGDDTLTYRIDRDEAFYDGTAEPADGAEFILSGILSRYNEQPQFYGGFFDDDIVEAGDVSPQPTGNLVTNGDFESGDVGAWYGNAFNIVTEGDNSFNFADVAAAGNPWDVNLSQNVDLTPGEYYVLTFDASTDSASTRDLIVGIGLSQDPYYAATQTVTLTDSTQTFSLVLPTIDDGTGNEFGAATSRVIFDMGADVGVVVLDNISLEYTEAPPVDIITPIADARTLGDSTVVLTGIATTPNYGFSNGQWYLQDATGGINVFFGGQGDLEVAPGDEHILYGTISSYNEQVQISVDSAEVVSTGNEVPFPLEIDLATFLDVEAAEQGMYVTLTETATYLAEESAWPVEGFSDWSGAGANVFFKIADDTITYRIDRDESFYDGSVEPEDGTEFYLSGILARYNEEAQFYGAFIEGDFMNADDVVEFGPISLPVSFDADTVNYELTDFGGNMSEIVVDPTDAENMVVKSVKTTDAATWAGTTVANESGFNEPIPFTNEKTEMSIRVWSPEAGLPIRLKVEDHTDVTVSVETEAVTTVAEDWETLTFDFSNEAEGTEALNLAKSYTKASIFFNFGTTGADAGELTFYWDDVAFDVPTSSENGNGLELPTELTLKQNYPNPFNPSTKIEFALPETGKAQIEVFNMLGQKVATLVNSQFSAGNHTISFNAERLTSGIYFYRLTTGSASVTKRMTLIK